MVELGKVARRPLEVARAGGLRRAAVAVVGAVRSAVFSSVRGAAGGLGSRTIYERRVIMTTV